MTGQVINEQQLQQLLCLYYDNFHNAHPILPPFPAFQKLRERYIPEKVLTVMRYIGAHYLPDKTAQEILRPKAFGIARHPLYSTKDPFLLQCLLLLAIVEHGDTGGGVNLIRNAVQLAYNLGMNTGSFARANSHGYLDLEAMWLRTYYELCIVDLLLNAPYFAKGELRPMLLMLHKPHLPNDEGLFSEIELLHPGRCLYTKRPEDSLGKYMFEHGFSSQTYRIRAAALLTRVLCLPRMGNYEKDFRAIEIQLSEFKACLGPYRVNGTRRGKSHWEEMIIQAQTMANMASIYLLQPHSILEHPLLIKKGSVRSASILHNFYFQAGQAASLHTAAEVNEVTIEVGRLAMELIDLLYSQGQLLHHAARHSPLVAVHGLITAFLVLAAGYFQRLESCDRIVSVRGNHVLHVLGALSKAWPLAGSVKKDLVQLMMPEAAVSKGEPGV